MPTTDTPLRYPGGKTQLAPAIATLMRHNNLAGGHYAEPFAGGAGVAWRLLFSGQASEIWLNDIDPAIHAFWHAAIWQTDALCERVLAAQLDIATWRRQREVFRSAQPQSLDLAFAALYLNRTNRSGILDGGVIGGNAQTGNYKLGCRFNKTELVRKLQRIGRYRDVVHLTNLDARLCIAAWDRQLPARALLNVDPPYYAKGSELYLNHFSPADHAALAMQLARLKRPWMLTYDDTPEIRALYRRLPTYELKLLYSAQVKRMGAELLMLEPKLTAPTTLQIAA